MEYSDFSQTLVSVKQSHCFVLLLNDQATTLHWAVWLLEIALEKNKHVRIKGLVKNDFTLFNQTDGDVSES